MKALKIVRPNEFEMVEVDSPRLGPSETNRLIVKPRWIMLCGSDIPAFTGSRRGSAYPMKPGHAAHECMGQVMESMAESFRPGDWILALPTAERGLAEHFVAEAGTAVKLPDKVARTAICCLIQPLATVMNGLDRVGDVRGRTVAVVGLGPIGLLFCWLLRQRGAGKIVGIDPLAHRCRLAESLGADLALPLSSLEAIHAVRQGLPAWAAPDLCVEAVGHQMDTVNDCLELVQNYGTVLAFGVPDRPVYALEYEVFFRKNVSLVAAVTPDWSIYLPKACNLFLLHQAEFEPLVTHQFPVREAARAFRLYARHEDGVVKAVLDAEHWE